MPNRVSIPLVVFALAMLATAVVYTSGIFQAHGELLYTALSLAALASLIVGLVRYRPAPKLPWALMALGVVLLAGGGLRVTMGSLGDLSAERSILPDMIALPGYLVIALSLALLLPRRGGSRVFDTMLDGVVASAATFALSWVFVVVPHTANTDLTSLAQVLLACYPACSMFLVVVSLRLVFDRNAHRTVAGAALLAALAAMLIGDIFYMLADLRMIPVHQHLLDIPYSFGFVALSLVAATPSCRRLSMVTSAADRVPSVMRLTIVGVGLFVPAALLTVAPMSSFGDRVVLVAAVLYLALAAIVRVVLALREQSRSQDRLSHQATHDSLTGLPNRVYVQELLDSAALRREPLTALFLDLDRFKQINDTLGHASGDELLVQTAQRLSVAVRDGDTVARIGGDEFVIIAPSLPAPAALSLAERVRWSLSEPFTLSRAEVFTAASVGVATTDGGSCSASRLVEDADTALYEAKRSGRDRVVLFSDSMRERIQRRVLIEQELGRAIERDELSVHFQPIVNSWTARPAGVEALLRWNRPDLKAFPDEFIPVAEESGLIVEIGAWVLDEACRNLALWRSTLPGFENLQVSVNVSARQLLGSDFPAVVAATLVRHGLPASALDLELTESLLIDSGHSGDDAVTRLSDLGVTLSVDDFGTGYSSLSYLKRFPVDRVKIDKSFVDGLDTGESSDRDLVRAIVAMADALGLATVAEGVETKDQAAVLAELHCSFLQGYHYAKPAPAEDVPAMLDSLATASSESRRLRLV